MKTEKFKNGLSIIVKPICLFICAAITSLAFINAIRHAPITMPEFTTCIMILLVAFLAVALSCAYDDVHEHAWYEREIWADIDDMCLDKNGNHCIRIWHRKALMLPGVAVDVIHKPVPAEDVYDLLEKHGKRVTCRAEYVRKQQFLTVTDAYTKITPIKIEGEGNLL